MNYISISLYRKMIDHALSEGMTVEDFKDLPIPLASVEEIKAVPADHFFDLHERLCYRGTLALATPGLFFQAI